MHVMKKQTICRYIIHIQSQNLEVYVSVQKLIFFQKLKILQVHFTSQHLIAVVWVSNKLGHGPFFAIIRAKMREI